MAAAGKPGPCSGSAALASQVRIGSWGCKDRDPPSVAALARAPAPRNAISSTGKGSCQCIEAGPQVGQALWDLGSDLLLSHMITFVTWFHIFEGMRSCTIWVYDIIVANLWNNMSMISNVGTMISQFRTYDFISMISHHDMISYFTMIHIHMIWYVDTYDIIHIIS